MPTRYQMNVPQHPDDNYSINKAFDRNYGNRLKSGDTTPLKYTIKDGDGEPLDKDRLMGMETTVKMKHEGVTAYEAEFEATLEEVSEGYEGDLVARYKIMEALPPSDTPYIVEFHFEEADDRFIFPSGNNLPLYITPSSLNSDGEAIKNASEQRLNEIVERKLEENPVLSEAEAKELARQENYQELLDTGVMQTKINERLEDLEEEYAPKLTEVTSQLAHKANHDQVASLNTMFQDVIQSADLDPNKDQEVVAARNGEATLGDALLKIDGKVDQQGTQPILNITKRTANLSVDSVAHGNLTFSDIFVERNFIKNSHFTNDLAGFVTGHGSPAISTDVYNTPEKSLKVFGTTSHYITNNTLPVDVGRKYFIAAKVKVDRYTSGGGIGFQVNSTQSSINKTIKNTTTDFETLSEIYTVPDVPIVTLLIGAIGSSNADGYVDDFIAIDLTDIPELDITELNRLYELYIQIIKGEQPTADITFMHKVLTEDNLSRIDLSSTLHDLNSNERVPFDTTKHNDTISFELDGETLMPDLNSEVCEGVTLSDLFVNRNIVPNSHFNSGMTGYSVGAGSPTVTNAIGNTPTNSLRISGTTSQNVKFDTLLTVGRKYFIAAKVNVVRYKAGGGLGFQIVSPTIGSISKRVQKVTDGFVTLSSVISVDEPVNNITLGSYGGSDLNGFVDDFVVVDITDIDTSGEFEKHYETYLSIIKGDVKVEKDTKTYRLYTENSTPVNHNDALFAFVDAMNKKAKDIGMENSHFVNVYGGDGMGHLVTARDLVKLGVHSVGYDELVKSWNKKRYTIKVDGPNAREVVIDSTVTDPLLENDYYIFGGKTGTTTVANLLVLVNAPNNNWFVGSVLNATGNRFEEAKKVFDIAKLYMDEGYTGTHDVASDKVAVALMPNHNPFAYEQYDIPLLWSKNADVREYPASVTKVMTCVTVLDYLKDLDEKIEIQKSDITGGSGPIFYAGDIVTVKDALYGMMLPSSNTLAIAAARVAGSRIIRG